MARLKGTPLPGVSALHYWCGCLKNTTKTNKWLKSQSGWLSAVIETKKWLKSQCGWLGHTTAEELGGYVLGQAVNLLLYIHLTVVAGVLLMLTLARQLYWSSWLTRRHLWQDQAITPCRWIGGRRMRNAKIGRRRSNRREQLFAEQSAKVLLIKQRRAAARKRHRRGARGRRWQRSPSRFTSWPPQRFLGNAGEANQCMSGAAPGPDTNLFPRNGRAHASYSQLEAQCCRPQRVRLSTLAMITSTALALVMNFPAAGGAFNPYGSEGPSFDSYDDNGFGIAWDDADEDDFWGFHQPPSDDGAAMGPDGDLCNSHLLGAHPVDQLADCSDVDGDSDSDEPPCEVACPHQLAADLATQPPQNDAPGPDPLPGFPAGQHSSTARKAALQTWDVLRPWYTVPSRIAKAARRRMGGKRQQLEDEEYQGITAKAQLETPSMIPASAFLGLVPGYVYTTRERVTAYYADEQQAQAPHAADDMRPAEAHAVPISINDCLLLSRDGNLSANQNVQTKNGKKRKSFRRHFVGPHARPPQHDTIGADWWADQGLWAVDTLNAGSFNSSAHYRAHSSADAVVLQETKTTEDAQDAMRKEAARHGWKMVSTAARRGSHGGRSSGAAVMTKARLALDEKRGLKLQAEPHRAAFADTSVAEGCTLISCYLRHSEGLSADNQVLLEQLAGELAQIDGPWIVGMDGNMDPEILQSSRWPDLVGAVLIAPDAPTCGDARLDYFAVSKDLAPAVLGTQVLTDTGTYPHCAVRMLIKSGSTRRLTRQLQRPSLVPGKLPCGPKLEDFYESHYPQHETPNCSWDPPLDCSSTSSSSSDGGVADCEAAAAEWVRKSRKFFSGVLGKELGRTTRLFSNGGLPRTQPGPRLERSPAKLRRGDRRATSFTNWSLREESWKARLMCAKGLTGTVHTPQRGGLSTPLSCSGGLITLLSMA